LHSIKENTITITIINLNLKSFVVFYQNRFIHIIFFFSRISSDYFTGTFIMSSVQRAFAHKLSKQHAADVRRQIATSTSYSRDLSKSGSSISGFSSTVSIQFSLKN